jgi:site-specific DNA recombinase
VRIGKIIERLLTAYQEELLSLEQLRNRMPQLRQREQALRTELQSIAEQTRERAAYLRLAETLSAFLGRLRVAARHALDILERQRIVRLVIKELLVGDDTIVIRHCIPVPSGPPHGGGPPELGHSDAIGDDRDYLLRSGRGLNTPGQHLPNIHWTFTPTSGPLGGCIPSTRATPPHAADKVLTPGLQGVTVG